MNRPPASHHFVTGNRAPLEPIKNANNGYGRPPTHQVSRNAAPPYALENSVAPGRKMVKRPLEPLYRVESARSRKKRERDERHKSERAELESMQNYNPFGRDDQRK